MLERRMPVIGIRKTLHLVPYIHSLSVTMAECNLGNWQPMVEFIRVLDLLPNLRDLTIVLLASEMVSVLDISRRGKVFPSVFRLTLNDQLEPIMPRFPDVQTLTYHWFAGTIGILKGKHIHAVNDIRLSPEIVESHAGLRDALPNVKQLSLWNISIQLDTLRLLEGMDTLSELRIRHRPNVRWHVHGGPEPLLQNITTTARRALSTSKARGPKELRIQEIEGSASGDVFGKKRLIIVVADM
ncbi:hypothetical protein B0H13DRAFT_2346185 [Mycena leptocephala]|nr:hypothetical protein B0H13DRAFT_2346185 [Mycena leptocephala]